MLGTKGPENRIRNQGGYLNAPLELQGDAVKVVLLYGGIARGTTLKELVSNPVKDVVTGKINSSLYRIYAVRI